jgi:hypothetical protein
VLYGVVDLESDFERKEWPVRSIAKGCHTRASRVSSDKKGNEWGQSCPLDRYGPHCMLLASIWSIVISTDPKECALQLWESGCKLEDVCFTLKITAQRVPMASHPPRARYRHSATKSTHWTCPYYHTCISDLYQAEPDLYQVDELTTWLTTELPNTPPRAVKLCLDNL